MNNITGQEATYTFILRGFHLHMELVTLHPNGVRMENQLWRKMIRQNKTERTCMKINLGFWYKKMCRMFWKKTLKTRKYWRKYSVSGSPWASVEMLLLKQVALTITTPSSVVSLSFESFEIESFVVPLNYIHHEVIKAVVILNVFFNLYFCFCFIRHSRKCCMLPRTKLRPSKVNRLQHVTYMYLHPLPTFPCGLFGHPQNNSSRC